MTPSQNLNSEEVERGKNVPSVIGVLSLDLDFDSVNILKELLVSSSNEGMIDGEVRLEVLLILSVLQSPFLSELFAISLSVSGSTSANQWFQMWYTNRLWRKKTLYRLLHTFLTQILQGKEFSSKNFRLRNISYSCTYNSSLINESLMLQHYRESHSTIKGTLLSNCYETCLWLEFYFDLLKTPRTSYILWRWISTVA